MKVTTTMGMENVGECLEEEREQEELVLILFLFFFLSIITCCLTCRKRVKIVQYEVSPDPEAMMYEDETTMSEEPATPEMPRSRQPLLALTYLEPQNNLQISLA